MNLFQLKPLAGKFFDVDVDREGMRADSLLSVMKQWDHVDPNSTDTDIPKLLYVNPTGTNPSGSCMSLERKQKIYEVCKITFFRYISIKRRKYHIYCS